MSDVLDDLNRAVAVDRDAARRREAAIEALAWARDTIRRHGFRASLIRDGVGMVSLMVDLDAVPAVAPGCEGVEF